MLWKKGEGQAYDKLRGPERNGQTLSTVIVSCVLQQMPLKQTILLLTVTVLAIQGPPDSAEPNVLVGASSPIRKVQTEIVGASGGSPSTYLSAEPSSAQQLYDLLSIYVLTQSTIKGAKFYFKAPTGAMKESPFYGINPNQAGLYPVSLSPVATVQKFVQIDAWFSSAEGIEGLQVTFQNGQKKSAGIKSSSGFKSFSFTSSQSIIGVNVGSDSAKVYRLGFILADQSPLTSSSPYTNTFSTPAIIGISVTLGVVAIAIASVIFAIKCREEAAQETQRHPSTNPQLCPAPQTQQSFEAIHQASKTPFASE